MLRDCSFDPVYSSGGTPHRPRTFFNLALSNSISFDLGLGFFSSACFNVLSYGFAKFISNGGTMRLYINHYLTEEDFDLFSHEPDDVIERRVLNDFEEILKVLSKRDKHFFNCLAFLIRNERIQIKVVIPKTGMAHQKMGVFTDEDGAQVGFDGSTNFSASALARNIESVSAVCSWKGGQEHIDSYSEIFDYYFNGKDKDSRVFDAIGLKKSIINAFPENKNLKELVDEEEQFLSDYSRENGGDFGLLCEGGLDTSSPRFPYITGARDYQKQAYNNWVARGYYGIFAMATGTGKTITSLNCVLEEYKKCNQYHVLILVPSIDLVYQWVGEVEKFNYQNVYVVNHETDWRSTLTQMKNDIEWGISRDFVIISTYQSFVINSFQKLISKLSAKNDDMILIADEAHNVGSEDIRNAFDNLNISKRIALSATPNRAYDTEGTQAIEGYFKDSPPYCYSFSMERAIKEGRLTKYKYYPRIAYLDSDEMEKYRKISRQLLAYYDSKTQSFKNCQEVTNLLRARKMVIHKAQDKYRVFEGIIDQLHKDRLTKYCFVYTPEGKDYSSSDGSRILLKMKNIVDDKYCGEIKTNSFTGDDPRKDRQDKFRAFAEGKIDMLFAMKCLDEGVDVPRAEVGVFTSSSGNPRQFIQRRGRLLRKYKDYIYEKQYATIYDIIVVPESVNSSNKSDYFDMERSVVKSELIRVAYFASLAINYYDAEKALKHVTDYYGFEISTLIDDLKQ